MRILQFIRYSTEHCAKVLSNFYCLLCEAYCAGNLLLHVAILCTLNPIIYRKRFSKLVAISSGHETTFVRHGQQFKGHSHLNIGYDLIDVGQDHYFSGHGHVSKQTYKKKQHHLLNNSAHIRTASGTKTREKCREKRILQVLEIFPIQLDFLETVYVHISKLLFSNSIGNSSMLGFPNIANLFRIL